MDKKQAFAFLDELQGRGISLGLSRIRKFLLFIGSPETRFRSVHVAGTNGKGSTAAMIESILREAGFKTGLYTSPHLVRFNERIQVNGRQISDKRLVELIAKLKAKMQKSKIGLTYFEFVTTLAFKHFANCRVDFAVVEVGMGGRLDATNSVKPAVSVITNVEREHEEHLGKTRRKIAAEKAGIIKKHVPVVTAEWKKPILRVFNEKCNAKNAKLVVVKSPFKGRLGLLGSFQRWNAALAIAAARELQKQGIEIDEKAIQKGLAKAEWPGRFEIVHKNPTVLLDCAHNPACCVVLSRAFKQAFPGKKCLLVFGASSNKNVARMAKLLSPLARKVFVTAAKYRAMPPKMAVACFGSADVEVVAGVGKALKKALSSAKKSDVVLVAGSCFLVGESIQALKTR